MRQQWEANDRGRVRRKIVAWVVSLALLGAARPSAGAPADAADSPLGIGFLWTAQSDQVVDRLGSEKDYVDVILGPGRLEIFDRVKPPTRVACISLALERNEARPFPGVKETIEILRKARVAPGRVIIAYNPERSPGTTARELDELLASVRRARELARSYGAPLMVGPGLREMMSREDLYPELAKNCDAWLIQSQRLQLDETTRKPVDVAHYRHEVKRIVDRLREGNPKIRIYVQLVTTAERQRVALSAEQIAAFARSIEDLVDAVRIYGARAELLNGIIDQLRPRGAARAPSAGPAPGAKGHSSQSKQNR